MFDRLTPLSGVIGTPSASLLLPATSVKFYSVVDPNSLPYSFREIKRTYMARLRDINLNKVMEGYGKLG